MDAELRSVEREANQGDPSAQARLLHERVRAGDLLPEDLELAAGLGHPIAMLASPGVAAIGKPKRGWNGMLRLIGRLSQRRPLAVAEWLVWIGAPKRWVGQGAHIGPALYELEEWIHDPQRMENVVPSMLCHGSPYRGDMLHLCLQKFETGRGNVYSFTLKPEGCELVLSQRLRLAELILRPREEPLPPPKRRRLRKGLVKVELSVDEQVALENVCVSCHSIGATATYQDVRLCSPCHLQRLKQVGKSVLIGAAVGAAMSLMGIPLGKEKS